MNAFHGEEQGGISELATPPSREVKHILEYLLWGGLIQKGLGELIHKREKWWQKLKEWFISLEIEDILTL